MRVQSVPKHVCSFACVVQCVCVRSMCMCTFNVYVYLQCVFVRSICAKACLYLCMSPFNAPQLACITCTRSISANFMCFFCTAEHVYMHIYIYKFMYLHTYIYV